MLKSLGKSTDDYDKTLFFLEEMKNPDSVWKPYFDILPIDTSNFPVLWNSQELEWLEGSVVKQWTRNKQVILEKDYNEIAKDVYEFREEYSLHEFLVARLLTKSRSFKLPVDGPNTK